MLIQRMGGEGVPNKRIVRVIGFGASCTANGKTFSGCAKADRHLGSRCSNSIGRTDVAMALNSSAACGRTDSKEVSAWSGNGPRASAEPRLPSRSAQAKVLRAAISLV